MELCMVVAAALMAAAIGVVLLVGREASGGSATVPAPFPCWSEIIVYMGLTGRFPGEEWPQLGGCRPWRAS